MKTARELWEAVYAAVEAENHFAFYELCDAEMDIRTASQSKIGPKALAGMFTQQRGLYAQLEHTVDGTIESADGSALSVELTLSGVPKGTDERLTWNVVETIRADAGRIVSWHAMLDRAGLVQRIRALQG
ncbi:nuclear transport factor 2 family protein [Actinacidiphila paucisporea]|uniref:SnoaL-like domain-containing protein n=1 Tax=Actinacidiphila paucisporea TaxID=310782 RepID=A0A1M7NWE4_9ACTN|nr:nuclear transport factor 2 family protein [Actinacidiphila paucisporea]SHN08429.1 SnoaL-like domain-containing protein [Actinacidiphila paucisporea]